MLIASGANGEPCSGDAVVATAILDRMHHSHVITIRGDSYRLRENRSPGLLENAQRTLLPDLLPNPVARNATNGDASANRRSKPKTIQQFMGYGDILRDGCDRISRPVPSTARPPIRLVDRILGNSANHPKGRIGSASASIADPAADPHLLADQVCIGKESRRCDGAARNPFGSLPFSRLLSILTVARASSLTEPGRDPSPGRFLFSVGEAGTAAGGRGAR